METTPVRHAESPLTQWVNLWLWTVLLVVAVAALLR
jgi:hypothetical protein